MTPSIFTHGPLKKTRIVVTFPLHTCCSHEALLKMAMKSGPWKSAAMAAGWLSRARTALSAAWNTQSHSLDRESTVLHRHDGPVEALAVGQDWVISADSMGTLIASSLRNATSRNLTQKLESVGIVRLAITADDRFVITANDGNVRRWTLSPQGIRSDPMPIGHHEELIDVIRVTPDDRRVITGSWDGTVMEWSIDGGSQNGVELGHLSEDVYAVAVSSQSVALAGAENGNENHVYVSTLGGGNQQQLAEGDTSPIVCLRFAESGRWLAAGSEDSGRITVWQLGADDQWQHVPLPTQHRDSVNSLVFDRDSELLASAGNDGQLILWDLTTATQRIAVLQRQAVPIVRMCLGAEGRWVFTASADGQVNAWDLQKCRVIKRACDRAGVTAQPASTPTTGVEA